MVSGSVEERDWVADEQFDLWRDCEPLRTRCCDCWVLRLGELALLAERLSVSSTALLSVEHRLALLPRRELRASLRL